MAWEVKPLRDRRGGIGEVLLTAHRYRLKAEECRTIADELRDKDARRAMLEVAAYYERLAGRHERSLPALVDAVNSPRRALTDS